MHSRIQEEEHTDNLDFDDVQKYSNFGDIGILDKFSLLSINFRYIHAFCRISYRYNGKEKKFLVIVVGCIVSPCRAPSFSILTLLGSVH